MQCNVLCWHTTTTSFECTAESGNRTFDVEACQQRDQEFWFALVHVIDRVTISAIYHQLIYQPSANVALSTCKTARLNYKGAIRQGGQVLRDTRKSRKHIFAVKAMKYNGKLH